MLIHLERLSARHLPAELLTSAVTLAELSAGVHQADDPAERGRRVARLQRVEAIFERCRSTPRRPASSASSRPGRSRLAASRADGKPI